MTDEINPFQAPAADDANRGSYAPSTSDPRVYVASGQLHARDGAELPLYCVESGVPIDESDMTTRAFYHTPAWILLLLLLNIVILLIAYFVVRKKCSVRYGLSKELRKTYRKRDIRNGLFLATGIGLMAWGGVSEIPLALVIGLVILLVALFMVMIGRRKFRLAGHDNGDFAFKGCSPKFLRVIESQMAAGYYQA
jgi:hypothetical protein